MISNVYSPHYNPFCFFIPLSVVRETHCTCLDYFMCKFWMAKANSVTCVRDCNFPDMAYLKMKVNSKTFHKISVVFNKIMVASFISVSYISRMSNLT